MELTNSVKQANQKGRWADTHLSPDHLFSKLMMPEKNCSYDPKSKK